MLDWIEIDPEAFQKSVRKSRDGVEIIVGLSPYDMPDKVRSRYDDEREVFVIEFKYIGNGESRFPDKQDETITLIVGEHSKRLYEIQVNVKRLQAKSVLIKLLPVGLSEAIDKLGKEYPDRSRIQHYEVAKDVISQKSEQLLAGV